MSLILQFKELNSFKGEEDMLEHQVNKIQVVKIEDKVVIMVQQIEFKEHLIKIEEVLMLVVQKIQEYPVIIKEAARDTLGSKKIIKFLIDQIVFKKGPLHL